jgi:hypothetical protein
MTPEDHIRLERQIELTELVLNAIRGLAEEDAVSAIVSAIAARFEGAALDKIVTELADLQRWHHQADQANTGREPKLS